MLKAIIPAGTSTVANTNIPLEVQKNTNRNTRYNPNNDTIEILMPGDYDLYVSLPLTGSSSASLILQEYRNGKVVDEAASYGDITQTTGIETFQIMDAFKITRNVPFGPLANIAIRVDNGTADLLSDGIVILERRDVRA